MKLSALKLPFLALSLCMALLFISPASHASGCPLGAGATCLTGQGNWTSTLQERSFDGGATIGGYFDTALNITWLANANVLGTTPSWAAANAWASSLNLGGTTGWRLPTMTDTGSPGCDFSFAGGTDCGYNVQTGTSELAHVFYATLGNKSYCPAGDALCAGAPQAGHGLTNTGPFANMVETFYWTNVAYGPIPDQFAWIFSFADGSQYFDSQVDQVSQLAWAVHAGDVGVQAVVPVPLPASAWQLLCGLLALAAFSWRRPEPGALGYRM